MSELAPEEHEEEDAELGRAEDGAVVVHDAAEAGVAVRGEIARDHADHAIPAAKFSAAVTKKICR